MHRVSGMGEKSSAKFSAQGLTVNGSAYQGGGTTEPAKSAQPEKPKSGSKS
jgi:competence protein ComEA